MTVDDQARVEGGAAHVDADQVRPPGCRCERLAANGTSDRPGEQRLQRRIAGRPGTHHSAVRFHHVQPAARQAAGERFDQCFEILPHHRSEIGVHHRGRDAFELAPFRTDPVRQRNRDPGQAALEIPGRLQFVLRVLETEQQGDRNRLVAFRRGGIDEPVEIRQAQRIDLLAVC